MKGVTLIPVLDGSVSLSERTYVRSLEEFSKHQGPEGKHVPLVTPSQREFPSQTRVTTAVIVP